MAGQLTVTLPEMDKFKQQMEDAHQMLIKHIQDTRSDQDRTTQTWSGGARGAFDTFMERYYEQAQAMNNKLSNTVDSLMKAAKDYGQQDDQFQQDISKQNSSLDLPGI